MIIIPADSRYSKNSRAFVTWALVALNCLIFFGVQISDSFVQNAAMEYYIKSDLPGLEIPGYLSHLKDSNRKEAYEEYRQMAEDNVVGPIVYTMQSDPGFLRRLHAGEIVTPDNARYAEWQSQRSEFETLYARSFTFSYVLKPDDPRPVTLLSHMFMHGSVDHLIGNMVFLALIGPLVELALGPWLFALAYLVTGLCAAGVFTLLNAGEATSILGASGAIAGVMGMFAFLFGMRRVRFFYTVLFYFGFITLPAVAVFPYWFVWEWLQFFLSEGSNVAFEAHGGGLLGGAIVGGAALLLKGQQNQARIDKPVEDDAWEQDFLQAMEQMRQLNLRQADTAFLRLQRRRPGEIRPLLQLYRISCLLPPSPLRYQRAETLFARLPGLETAEDKKLLLKIFDSYLDENDPAQLSTDLLLSLSLYFAAEKAIVRFDNAIKPLLKSGCRDPRLGQALRQLLASNGLTAQKRKNYRILADRFFPLQA